MEPRRSQSHQNRNRMFQLMTGHAQIDRLRLCRIKLRLRQQHVRLRRDASREPVIRQLQVVLVNSDVLGEKVQLRIGGEQRKIIHRERSLQAQPQVFQIGRLNLRIQIGALHRKAHAVPQIRHPGRAERQSECGRCARASRVRTAVGLRDRRTCRNSRVVSRAVQIDAVNRPAEQRLKLLDGVVRSGDLFFEPVELRISEDLPPLAFQIGIAGRCRLPQIASGQFAEGLGRLHRGT